MARRPTRAPAPARHWPLAGVHRRRPPVAGDARAADSRHSRARARVKALYLLRHAKSSWADDSLADHDRPLASRGKKATRVLARHLFDAGIRPALVLCSTAARARQTFEGVAASLGDDVDVWEEESLYGAGSSALLRRLRRLPPAVPSVMVVAHNPGLEDLAMDLIEGGDE